MQVHKIIIHELVKVAKVNEASTFLGNTVLPINETTENLVFRLNESYNKDKIINATFTESMEDDFPVRYNNYYANGLLDTEFVTFSRETLTTLRGQIQNVFLAKGGYFVYADYSVHANRYTGVFLVRDSDGMLFKRNSSGFDVDNIRYMNTEKLAMGCRIHNDKFRTRTGKYLTLINNKQTDISDYFTNWINIARTESSTHCTNLLYEVVNQIELPQNPSTSLPYDLDDFRKIVVDYVLSQPNKIVNLRQMSLHFYQDEDRLTNFIQENDIELDNEFKIDSRALKKFYKLEVNSDNIQLRFTRGDYSRGKIRLSADNPNAVIIESQAFANELRVQLNNPNL